MSTDRETTRIVRAWLSEGATALPDRVLDAVLDQVPSTPQRHAWRPAWIVRALNRTNQRHAPREPRRYTPLNGLTKWAAAAVVVAVVGGLVLVILQPKAAPNVAAPVAATAAPATAPPATIGLPTGNAVGVGAGRDFTCAITTSGGVKCWGHNVYGYLGNGTTTESRIPVDVSGLTTGVTAIALGGYHACALTRLGGVRCWGWNIGGQLGNGSITASSVPVDVSGLSSGVTAIAAGSTWSCALTSGGGAKCWGFNNYGQLGNGTTDNASTPVDVAGLASGAAAIAAGGRHTCALTSARALRCWGDNEQSQLGDGSKTGSSIPVDVAGLTTGVTAFAVGDYHTCASLVAGGVKCWGFNARGQLGNGTTASSGVPVDVASLTTGVIAIAAGRSDQLVAFHTCALTSVGGVKCWGFNSNGQLGNGTTTSSSVPVDVSSLETGATAITVGGTHSCALLSGGVVQCWGSNTNGRLGDGTTTDRSTPVVVKGI